MSVLVDIASGRVTLAEGGFAYSLWSVLGPAVVPAREARPGAVGLLSYDAAVWRQFVSAAERVDVPAVSDLGFAAVPVDDTVVVLPNLNDDGEETIALWEVDDDGLLSVVVADIAADIETIGLMRAIADAIESRWQRFRRVPRERRCANRALTLACSARECRNGRCHPESWFDPKRQTELYHCVCREW